MVRGLSSGTNTNDADDHFCSLTVFWVS